MFTAGVHAGLRHPIKVADYWQQHVITNSCFTPGYEYFAVRILDTRWIVKGHQLLTIRTMDTLFVHPREVFRGATSVATAAVALIHNHPSDDAMPSEANVKVMHDIIRAG